MNTKSDKAVREADGRYGYNTFALACRCGHTLGVHAAENATRTRPCFNGDEGLEGATGEQCSCQNFRKAR